MGALKLPSGEVFMGIALAAGLTLALVMASVLIHYEILYGASRLIPRLSIPGACSHALGYCGTRRHHVEWSRSATHNLARITQPLSRNPQGQ